LVEGKKLEDSAKQLLAESEAIDAKSDIKLARAEKLMADATKIYAGALNGIQDQVS
jgi:hypothetical protein